MEKPSSPKAPEEKANRKSLLGWFLAKDEPDKDFLPDLKLQWGKMDRANRAKFVLGAIVGAVLFTSALLAVYLILAAIVG
jgi:hypothetical protein